MGSGGGTTLTLCSKKMHPADIFSIHVFMLRHPLVALLALWQPSQRPSVLRQLLHPSVSHGCHMSPASDAFIPGCLCKHFYLHRHAEINNNSREPSHAGAQANSLLPSFSFYTDFNANRRSLQPLSWRQDCSVIGWQHTAKFCLEGTDWG